MTTGTLLLAELQARGVRVSSPLPGRLRLVVPAGAISAEELAALRPRKAEILAALAEPPHAWLERRTWEWLLHLRAHDADRADPALCRELALDDWRRALVSMPRGVQ